MTREEATQYIKRSYAIDEDSDEGRHHNEVMDYLLSVLNESDNWIPVSERLPEEDKEVLIFTKDKEINKAYHTPKEWSDTQWEWFVFGTLGYSLTYSDDEVLAWQPLPEPYKAEKGGE